MEPGLFMLLDCSSTVQLCLCGRDKAEMCFGGWVGPWERGMVSEVKIEEVGF